MGFGSRSILVHCISLHPCSPCMHHGTDVLRVFITGFRHGFLKYPSIDQTITVAFLVKEVISLFRVSFRDIASLHCIPLTLANGLSNNHPWIEIVLTHR
eukprot:5578699-Amphidinium_carterae.4